MEINRKIENIKNIVIVVLFMMAILLLYLLWKPSLKEISADVIRDFSATGREVPTAGQLIRPLYTAVSSGDGSFSLCMDNQPEVLKQAESEIAGYLSSGNAQLQEITKGQYDQAMSEWASVQLEIGIGLPLSEFCEYFCEASPDGASSEVLFDVLSFSRASSESFFAVDRSKGRYYRIISDEARASVELLSKTAGEPVSTCYKAASILGGGDALISLSMESTLQETYFATEGSENPIARGEKISETIFGDTFDFVRRITDTYGNVTYMYGYGEKTFYASVAGEYVYNTEEASKEQTGLFEDLNTAAASLVRWGGLETGDLQLVLEDYKEEGSGKNRKRTFAFSQSCSGFRVLNDDIYAAVVTVCGGSVTRLERRASIAKAPEAGEGTDTAQAVNVIANNSNHIYNILSNNTLAAASDEAFATAAEETVTLVPGYYASQRTGTLIPSWVLKTSNGTRFFFDLYSGTPLGFARKEG